MDRFLRVGTKKIKKNLNFYQVEILSCEKCNKNSGIKRAHVICKLAIYDFRPEVNTNPKTSQTSNSDDLMTDYGVLKLFYPLIMIQYA